MRGCKDPVGSQLHHTSQSDSVFGLGEVEVLELFLNIAITLGHKELSVSQFEMVFCQFCQVSAMQMR